MDNGSQSCCAGAAFHHYVEVMSVVQHLYSSDIPSGSACAIVASLGLKSSSKETQCISWTEMKLSREIGH